MAKLTHEERVAVLLAWRSEALAAGFSAPSVETLDLVCRENSVTAVDATADPALEPWAKTVTFLLRQLGMGVNAPTLSSDLKKPAEAAATEPAATASTEPAAASSEPAATPATANPAPVGADTTRIDALLAWRVSEIAKGTEGIAALKDAHLRTIDRRGFTTVEEIATVLPASSSVFAPAIAALLASLAAPEEAPAAPAAKQEKPAPASAGAVPTASAPDVPKDFVPFKQTPLPENPNSVRGVYSAESELVLSWDKAPSSAAFTIYRVVSSDEYLPYNPDSSDVIGVTTGRTVTDPRPHTSAVRYVQVWAHSGADQNAAKANQPELHAQGMFVARPFNVDIREDEGQVIGQWNVWPKIEKVLVYRIPFERAAHGEQVSKDSVNSDADNKGGFVDPLVEGGKDYLYKASAKIVVGGVPLTSEPVSVKVHISDVIEAVTDVVAIQRGDEESPRFDLSWTPPAGGQVVIYRTAEPPRAGVDVKALAETALEQTGLVANDKLAHPVTATDDGRMSMLDVPWPRGWIRAYFTPVTLLGGQAFAGTTTMSARTESIRKAKIVERVNKQVVTFAWPIGATSVLIYTGPSDQPAEVATKGGKPHSISADQYKQLGGFRFPAKLPADGCDVHLVPVTFLASERIEGKPTTLPYPPLLPLRYESKLKRNALGTITGTSITIFTTIDLDGVKRRPPSFTLVYNADRFPLSMHDGTAIAVLEEGMEGVASSTVFAPRSLSTTEPNSVWKTDPERWKSTVATNIGFIRLFVNLPPEKLVRVALLDPAPAQLAIVSLARKLGMNGG